MKKSYVHIILFCLIFSGSLDAQNIQEKPFVREHLIGLTVGMNKVGFFSEGTLSYTDINDEFIVSSPLLFRYAAGISYKYITGKNTGLLCELLYNQKGGYNEFAFDMEGNSTNITLVNHKADYAELSLLTNVHLGKKKSIVNLYLGPHIAFLIKQNIIFLEETYGKTFTKKTSKKFAYGINAGAGYSFHFNKGEVEMRILYNHDFSNIFPEKSVNNFSFNQNQVLALSLSYYYKL